MCNRCMSLKIKKGMKLNQQTIFAEKRGHLFGKFRLVFMCFIRNGATKVCVFFSSSMKQTEKVQENAAFYFVVCNREWWFCNKIAQSVCLYVHILSLWCAYLKSIFKRREVYNSVEKWNQRRSFLHREWNDFVKGGTSCWTTI